MHPPCRVHSYIFSLTHHSLYSGLLHCLLTGLTASALHSWASILNTPRASIVAMWYVQEHRPYTQKGPMFSFMFCCHHLEILHNFWTNGHAVSFHTGFSKLCSQSIWIHYPIRLTHRPDRITPLLMTLQKLPVSFRAKDKSPTMASRNPHDTHPIPLPPLWSHLLSLCLLYILRFLKYALSTSTLGPLPSSSVWLLHSYLNIASLLCSPSHIISDDFCNHPK